MSDLSILLPYQQRWLQDDSPVKVWEKSRRIGATWCEAADAVLIAGRQLNPMDYYYTSINEQLSREFIRDCTNWAKQFDIAIADAGEVLLKHGAKSFLVQQITFASGKKVMGLPNNPDLLRGRTGVYLADEYAFLQNPAENLKAAMAFLMWGGKVRILSTHNGEDSDFNEIIKSIRAEKLRYSLHRTTLDDALDDGLYRRICLKTKTPYSIEGQDRWRQDLIDFYGEGANEELFCIPCGSGGSYFSRILVERAMETDIPVFNLTLKDEFALLSEDEKTSQVGDWLNNTFAVIAEEVATSEVSSDARERRLVNPYYKSSFGFDFGRSGDLSYLVVFQELPNLIRKSIFALELRNVPFTEQEQILFWICDRLPRLVGGALDAKGNGAFLAEKTADRYGRYRIEQVQLSQKWYLENMPKYKAALEDKKVLLPANSDLLDDHRLVQVIKGIPKVPDTRTKGTDGKLRHGDGAIACALAWYASSMDTEDCVAAVPSLSFAGWETIGSR
jgi:phage FluMu gp28-like protein